MSESARIGLLTRRDLIGRGSRYAAGGAALAAILAHGQRPAEAFGHSHPCDWTYICDEYPYRTGTTCYACQDLCSVEDGRYCSTRCWQVRC